MSSNNRVKENDDLLDHKEAVNSYLQSLLEPQPSARAAEQKVPTDRRADSYVPPWATTSFSALYFRSAGLHLYLPLAAIRGIKNVGNRVEPIVAGKEWIAGRLKYKAQDITVVDTGKLLIDSSKRTLKYRHLDENAYVILLDDGSFGLSCDMVGQVKQLSRSDINWRASSKENNYLHGMLKREVAGLLDVRRIALAISMHKTLV